MSWFCPSNDFNCSLKRFSCCWASSLTYIICWCSWLFSLISFSFSYFSGSICIWREDKVVSKLVTIEWFAGIDWLRFKLIWCLIGNLIGEMGRGLSAQLTYRESLFVDATFSSSFIFLSLWNPSVVFKRSFNSFSANAALSIAIIMRIS